jgi:hypothetical protein
MTVFIDVKQLEAQSAPEIDVSLLLKHIRDMNVNSEDSFE